MMTYNESAGVDDVLMPSSLSSYFSKRFAMDDDLGSFDKERMRDIEVNNGGYLSYKGFCKLQPANPTLRKPTTA